MEVPARSWLFKYSVGVACLVLGFFVPQLGFAARLDDLELWPSLQETAKGSDYTVYFVTPSGVQDTSDTIMLTFDDAFDFGGWGYPPEAPRDVDLAYDNDGVCDGPWTDVDLASMPSATDWGVNLTGNVLVFTPATSVSIDTDTCIQIELGRNASHQEVAIGQLKNPSTTAAVSLDVTGGFGDTGSLVTAMVPDAVLRITASVYVPPQPNGHQYLEGPSTLRHLMMTHERVVYDGSALMATWNTNYLADSTVEYWKDGQEEDVQTFRIDDVTREHVVRISDPEVGQLYYVRLHSKMASGQQVSSVVFPVLVTEGTGDVFIDVEVERILPHAMQGRLRSSIPLSGKFKTYVLDSTAYLRPLTTIPLFQDRSFLQSVRADDWALGFTDLYDQVRYALVGTLYDALGNVYRAYTEYVTPPDLAPANVHLVSHANTERILLRWALPAEDDLGDVIIVSRSDRYPEHPDDGVLVHTGMGHALDIVRNNEDVYITVFTRDLVGQLSSGVQRHFPAEDPALAGGDIEALQRVEKLQAQYEHQQDRGQVTVTWEGPRDGRYRVVRRGDRPAMSPFDGGIHWDTQDTRWVDTSIRHRGTYVYTVFSKVGGVWDAGRTVRVQVQDPYMQVAEVFSPIHYAYAQPTERQQKVEDRLFRFAVSAVRMPAVDADASWRARVGGHGVPVKQGAVRVLPHVAVQVGHAFGDVVETDTHGALRLTEDPSLGDGFAYAGVSYDAWGAVHTVTSPEGDVLKVDVVEPGRLVWDAEPSVAMVTLEKREEGIWRPVVDVAQENPQRTMETFGWHVPNSGVYRVVASASGYQTAQRRVWVGSDGIVRPHVSMRAFERSVILSAMGSWGAWLIFVAFLVLIFVAHFVHRREAAVPKT